MFSLSATIKFQQKVVFERELRHTGKWKTQKTQNKFFQL